MDNPSRQQLLSWASNRDERSFRAVVERYAGLVHGVALRKTGNPELAAEAAQAVFVKLAQKPREAAPHPAAWLHRAAVFEAQHAMRTEFRHRRRAEALAQSMNEEPAHETWSAVRGHLDEALNDLPAGDRRVLMLRYFEERTASQIGEATGISSEAAQKRTVRALERLSGLLRRRGVAVPAAMLAAGLTQQLTESVSAALVSKFTAAATSAAPSTGFLTTSLAVMSSAKLTTAAIVALAAAVPVTWDAVSARSSVPTVKSVASAPSPSPSSKPDPAESTPLADFLKDLDRLANAGDDPPPGLELQLRRRIMEMDAAEIRTLAAALPQRPNPAALYDIVSSVYGRWMEIDPEGAKTAVLACKQPYLKHAARHGLLMTWGASDPKTALKWVNAHPDINEMGFAMMNVFRGWAHTNPRAAADGALTVPDESRSAAVHAALQTWATSPKETEAAVQWVNAVMDDSLRHKASSTLVSAMREWPMEDAVRTSLLIEDAESRTEGIELPIRFSAIKGEENAKRAAVAFRELPPERQDPDIAGRTVASASMYGGLSAGRAFIDQLPEGSAREEASERFASFAAQENKHEEAAAYAARLPLESGMTRMDLFAAGWAMRDAAAAQAWVQSLPEGPHRLKAEEGLAFAAKNSNARKK